MKVDFEEREVININEINKNHLVISYDLNKECYPLVLHQTEEGFQWHLPNGNVVVENHGRSEAFPDIKTAVKSMHEKGFTVEVFK